MLKAIEQMAQSGSRDEAAKCSRCCRGSSNPSSGQRQGRPADRQSLERCDSGLRRYIGRQRQLLDKTYRQQQGAGDPHDGGGKGLSGDQGKLREDLDKIAKGLGANKTPKYLGDAGKHMGDAQGQLGSNDFDNAEAAEKNALQAMQDTADQLAKKMMEEAGQNGQQNQEGQDPLGREQGTTGPAAGSGVKIPDRDELARARSILEALRRQSRRTRTSEARARLLRSVVETILISRLH